MTRPRGPWDPPPRWPGWVLWAAIALSLVSFAAGLVEGFGIGEQAVYAQYAS